MKRKSSFLRNMWDDNRGMLSVEFVVVLPMMIFWFFGSYVFYDTFHKWMKAASANSTIADLISRQQSPDIATIYAMDPIFDHISQTADDANTYFVFTVLRWVDTNNDGVKELDVFCSESTKTAIGTSVSLNQADLLKIAPTTIPEDDHIIYIHSYTPFVPLFNWVFGNDEDGNPRTFVFENKMVSTLRFATQLELEDSCPDPAITTSDENDGGDPYDPEAL